MKILKKMTLLLILASFLGSTPVFAELNKEEQIVTKVTQIKLILELMETKSSIKALVAPGLIRLIDELKAILSQPEKVKVEKPKKERIPYHIRNQNQVKVDGYETYGSETAATVEFVIEVENDGDNDIQIDEFTFTVQDPQAAYTVEVEDELSANLVVNNYQISIEDGADDAVVLGTYVIDDGSTETFTILVDISANTTGFDGRYELELTGINWTDTVTATTGRLSLSGRTNPALLAKN